MSQIKQLLLLHQQGKGKKTIARILGMSKTTVKVYLNKLQSLTASGKGVKALTITDLVKLESPVLEAKFHPGNPAYKQERYEHLKANLEFYLSELKRTGVNKSLLWEEYRRQYPDGYSHSQFCYHLQQHQLASKPSMVLEHKPAEKLFIDFAGKKLSYVDKETGELIACQVFVACLPYSDYSFAMAVRSQSTEDFLYALTCCLQALGGGFRQPRWATVVPARAKKPQDKALKTR